ncbi:hypothetical protein HYX14_06120 [Candidatus Woesearchaeota archaeon]|nr:hypothetical protein [Candidatus Woesearchaeota archaeon]
MNEEDHRKAVRESLEVIKEAVYKGMEQRQRTLGFHCSAVAIDLLELFLHQQNCISPGKILKHDFFSSEKKALRKLPEEFPDKEKVIAMVVKLEAKRNSLCYGKRKPKKDVEEYLALFRTIQQFLETKGIKADGE